MNERALCEIWNSMRFRRDALRDVDGRALQLVYRGRWQHGAGPDFRGAIIARGDGSLSHGDVEVHLRTSDWYNHHHERDPAFAGVVLHVVLHHDANAPTLRSDGLPVPVLALAAYLGDAAVEGEEGRNGPWPEEPCRHATRGAEATRLALLLDEQGDRRLRDRVAAYEGDLTALDPDEVLYRGLLDAMGYSQNRAPFRELAMRLPLSELAAAVPRLPGREREDALARLLLRAAGLQPVAPTPRAAVGEQAPGPPPSVPRDLWRLSGIRPANHPIRRLRGVAALIDRYLDHGLANGLCLDWPPGHPRGACVALRRRLLVAAPPGEPGPRHLIGPGRAADVVLNVVLPFSLAYAELHGLPALAAAARAAYRVHPRLAENEYTRAMADLLIAGEQRRALLRTARRQQGLLHLFRLYCDHRRCGECPAAAGAG